MHWEIFSIVNEWAQKPIHCLLYRAHQPGLIFGLTNRALLYRATSRAVWKPTNRAHPKMTHDSLGFHWNSEISQRGPQHVPTHDLAIHAPEHVYTRSKYKKACLFNTCRPMSQKILRSMFRIAWLHLPMFRKLKPMIQARANSHPFWG
jgi:hypothetical protein